MRGITTRDEEATVEERATAGAAMGSAASSQLASACRSSTSPAPESAAASVEVLEGSRTQVFRRDLRRGWMEAA